MNSEMQLLVQTGKQFVEKEIAPHYAQWERDGIYPRELWKKLGNVGFLGMEVPEQYGGSDVSFEMVVALSEEILKYGYMGVFTGMGVHGLVSRYILNSGTENQRMQYLPRMCSGDLVGALAMTEPGGGSDLQDMKTRADKTKGGYVLNGAKTFITNGQHCDLVVVAARTNREGKGAEGISLFLVETSLPGFKRGRNLEKMGQNSADTSELFFDDIHIPKTALLGELNGGFKVLMNELIRERLLAAVCNIACATGALELTIEYVKNRKVFGKPLQNYQNTRFKLAEMETEIRLNRALTNEYLSLFKDARLDSASASIVKLSSSEMLCRVVDDCLQLFGGYGYMKEYPICRFYVDARVTRIYGGASEVMKEIIARSILA